MVFFKPFFFYFTQIVMNVWTIFLAPQFSLTLIPHSSWVWTHIYVSYYKKKWCNVNETEFILNSNWAPILLEVFRIEGFFVNLKNCPQNQHWRFYEFLKKMKLKVPFQIKNPKNIGSYLVHIWSPKKLDLNSKTLI
jgi:hypothetical protein